MTATPMEGNGGAPTGRRNGMYRYGAHNMEALTHERRLSDLQRESRALPIRLVGSSSQPPSECHVARLGYQYRTTFATT